MQLATMALLHTCTAVCHGACDHDQHGVSLPGVKAQAQTPSGQLLPGTQQLQVAGSLGAQEGGPAQERPP